jgi:hypothetical protein
MRFNADTCGEGGIRTYLEHVRQPIDMHVVAFRKCDVKKQVTISVTI